MAETPQKWQKWRLITKGFMPCFNRDSTDLTAQQSMPLDLTADYLNDLEAKAAAGLALLAALKNGKALVYSPPAGQWMNASSAWMREADAAILQCSATTTSAGQHHFWRASCEACFGGI